MFLFLFPALGNDFQFFRYVWNVLVFFQSLVFLFLLSALLEKKIADSFAGVCTCVYCHPASCVYFQVVLFLAVLVVCYMLSAVVSLAFEAPMLALEKLILSYRKNE